MSSPLSDNMALLVATSLVVLLVGSCHAHIVRSLQTMYHRLRLQVILRTGLGTTDKGTSTDASQQSAVVSGLFIHPVKSLRAVPCTEAVLDAKGLVGDRQYMLVTPAPVPLIGHFGPDDATHRFLTQRSCPSLARVVVQYSTNGQSLTFSSDVAPQDALSCTISTRPDPKAPLYRSTLWGSIMTVQDMGDEAAAHFAKLVALDTEVPDEIKAGLVRLVVQHATDTRVAKDVFVPPVARSWWGSNPRVAFADGFPLLIASESSLAELNRRLQEKGKDPLPMARFRPNIVIRGDTLKPFAEDRIKMVQIGSVVYHLVASCARCKESCTDQRLGIVTEEPVATMKEFRRLNPADQDGVYFAVNAIPAPGSEGCTIRVGDTVKILEWGEPVWGDP